MQKSAFTLVELLVVIVIVGILAAVSIPMITGTIEKAKWTEAVQNLGVIRRALRTYHLKFGDYPTAQYYLNGSLKNCPASLDIGLPAPDDEGRYVYLARPKSMYPTWGCAYTFHDKNKNGSYDSGEPILRIFLDGHFTSSNGAPKF